MRIAHRWDVINEETNALENAKTGWKKKYILEVFWKWWHKKKQLFKKVADFLLFKL